MDDAAGQIGPNGPGWFPVPRTDAKPALRWTNKPPTVLGWWWVIYEGKNLRPEAVKITRGADGKLYVLTGDLELYPLPPGKWCGPIEEPK